MMIVLLWIVVIIALVNVLLGLGFYIFQFKFLFRASSLPQSYIFSFNVPFDEVFIPSGKNLINGLVFKSREKKGLIIYFHGNANNLAQWGFIANSFVEKGYDLLIVDYPTFGKSTGRINQKNLIQLGRDVYDYGLQLYPECRIVLYGRSIGSGIASTIAAERKPSLLVLETPYVSIKRLVDHHAPRFSPTSLLLRFTLNNKENIKDVECPVLIFHGTKDTIVPFDQAEELATVLKPNDKLISLKGGSHNNLGEFYLYHEQLQLALDEISLPVHANQTLQ